MSLSRLCVLCALIILGVEAATVVRGPFGWSLKKLRFNDPDHFGFLQESEATNLNCSFTSTFRVGVIGWIQCPIGPTKKMCRHLWIPYDNMLSIDEIQKYDDGHEVHVTAFRKDTKTTVLVETKITLSPQHGSLGGHACVYIPYVGDKLSENAEILDDNVLQKTFFMTAHIKTKTWRKGPIFRARFSVSKRLVPHISITTLIGIQKGPSIHTIGRFMDEKTAELQTRSVHWSKKTFRDRTIFSLTANISSNDLGLVLEVADTDGALIATTTVRTQTKRSWKACEIFAVLLTIIAALATVTIAVPNAEKPFAVWCALCIGWLIRGIIDNYTVQ